MAQSIADEVPNGLCQKCGMFLLNTAGKQKTCVNCDIKSEPSGVVNDLEDPGHEAMAKILGKQVASVPEVHSEIKAAKAGKPLAPEVGGCVITGVEQALEYLRNYYAVLPIGDMKGAKALLKLRKDIQTLADKIHNYNQGE